MAPRGVWEKICGIKLQPGPFWHFGVYKIITTPFHQCFFVFFTFDYLQNVVIIIIIVFCRNRCRTLRLYHANTEKVTTLPSLETDVPPWSAVFDPCGRLWCVQNDSEAPVIVFEPKGTGVDQTVCDVLKIISRCRNRAPCDQALSGWAKQRGSCDGRTELTGQIFTMKR